MFKIVDSVDKGKIVIAAKDIRPGEIITEEVATLFMRKDEHLLKQYVDMEHKTGVTKAAWCLYDAFLRLSEENRELVLNLFGPTTIQTCTMLRQFLGASKILPEHEIEAFVKLYSVATHNAFGEEMGVESNIFTGAVTRICSSCNPNCTFILKDNSCRIIAKVYVKIGEELTTSYNGDYDKQPTHVRRANLLRTKGFLCMCPRCTAPGDDNRQFNCSDAQCCGRMLACQPISEDVPYLLPCSVCKRSASEAFTAEMFAIEKRLPEIAKQLEAGFKHASINKIHGSDRLRVLMGDLIPPAYPTCHILSLALSDAVCAFLADNKNKRAFYQALDDVLLPFVDRMNVPSQTLCSAFHFIAIKLITIDVLKAKEYMQKALRMFMLIAGRDKRNSVFDSTMNMMFIVQSVEKKNTPDSLMECAFCGETPEAVAITLSRCARCEKVTYCGRGCQLAHWEQHKKTCKKMKK